MPPRHQLLLLNGPNLNLLGVREPERYGTTTLQEIEDMAGKAAAEHGIAIQAVQSNHEGVLIDTLHAARTTCAGVIINPGGLTHTSVSLRDAVAAVALPTVEVHITNIHRKEPFRHHSYISGVADAVIAGAGPIGYVLAVTYLAHALG
ncbi:type II 3-dehydroquinate dehydratase [Dactylosporangium sp. NPDC000244]|uniref:type II 3-dehydroquinate dehydratase n=1 Tax=Dactylosporangium sp. NPDC000244 TaxID=3154365 RepID=UPI00332F3C09